MGDVGSEVGAAYIDSLSDFLRAKDYLRCSDFLFPIVLSILLLDLLFSDADYVCLSALIVGIGILSHVDLLVNNFPGFSSSLLLELSRGRGSMFGGAGFRSKAS